MTVFSSELVFAAGCVEADGAAVSATAIVGSENPLKAIKTTKIEVGVRMKSCSEPFFFHTRDDFVDADAEVVVQHQHFAPRDQAVVHEHVNGIAGKLVELDD